MTISENYLRLRSEINKKSAGLATLVAVTKGYPLEALLQAYEVGCQDFGESRVQEAFEKMRFAPKDIRWHLIGTLQKKKVRKVIGKFHLIHSVDSVSLAEKIAEASKDEGLVTNVLLQINTSKEPSKHGMTPLEFKEILPKILELSGIKVKGLMTMAPFVEDLETIRTCFAKLRELREEIHQDEIKELSMGMTHDWPIAIEEGSTLLRIGTAIFAVNS